MKPKKIKKSGFALMIVIFELGLIGVELFVLAGSSNTIIFQTNQAYLEAVQQNLVTSGLAWAEKNAKDRNVENFNKTIQLDLDAIGITRAELRVEIQKTRTEPAKIRVNTQCNYGRETLTCDKIYHNTLANVTP